MIKHQTHLRYVGGGSDKVYSVWLRQDTGRGVFSVDYAYGKTGSTPQTGTKTPGGEPDEARATKIYEKLVSSKTAKGYVPTEPMALQDNDKPQ